MRRVVVVCEGQTEEAFISRVLYPAFVGLGLHLHGITVETSPGHKGGAMRYDRLRPALRNALANGRVVAVTMLVDLYKLAPDFPGYATAMAQSDLAAKLAALQSALAGLKTGETVMLRVAGPRGTRFVSLKTGG